jgi:hypothetical protein
VIFAPEGEDKTARSLPISAGSTAVRLRRARRELGHEAKIRLGRTVKEVFETLQKQRSLDNG